jgi:hypothetical protein
VAFGVAGGGGLLGGPWHRTHTSLRWRRKSKGIVRMNRIGPPESAQVSRFRVGDHLTGVAIRADEPCGVAKAITAGTASTPAKIGIWCETYLRRDVLISVMIFTNE